jgi:hypothetical protein
MSGRHGLPDRPKAAAMKETGAVLGQELICSKYMEQPSL